MKSLASMAASSRTESARDSVIVTKGSLSLIEASAKPKQLVTLHNFEIVQARESGKCGRKKLAKASAQTGANPLMTLDFFEGSGVGSSQKG